MAGIDYDHVNGTLEGNPDYPIDATVSINRSIPILKDVADVVTAVERFDLHGARLPLFDTTRNEWKIGMRPVGGGAVSQYIVDWSSFTGIRDFYEQGTGDADRYLYSYKDVASGIDLAFDNLASSLGIAEVDRPRFEYDLDTHRFHVVTTAAYRGAYDTLVNDSFQFALNTFDIILDTDAGWYVLDIQGDDFEQANATLEFLSPVRRIAVKSNGLPVKYELIDPPSTGFSIADGVGSFLVDFKYTQVNNQSIQALFYLPEGADQRWHNLTTGVDLRSFTLSFNWVGFDGVFHKILVPPQGSVTVKLLFQRNK